MDLESTVGILEQGLSNILIRSMTSLEGLKDKLKHPRLSVGQTALVYVALFLKAWNPKASDRVARRQRTRLQDFIGECRLFDALRTSTPRGSGVQAVRKARTRSEQCVLFDKLVDEDPRDMWHRLTGIPPPGAEEEAAV